MDIRSSFLLGEYVFIKLINTNMWNDLLYALKYNNFIPLELNEVAINYLLSFESENLVSPNTRLLISDNIITLSSLNKYKNKNYNDVYDDLLKNRFKPISFSETVKGPKSILIMSQRVDGNLNSFLQLNKEKRNKDKIKENKDALIHIAYLYFQFQKKYKMLHGDPKIPNYTWKKLDKPIDITYDFSDEFNPNLTITRKNVKNLFYLTDLEFVYSPTVKSKTINNQLCYFNFTNKYDIPSVLRDDRSNLLIVPKLSSDAFYDYNTNLLLGIDQKIVGSKNTIKGMYEIFPRMFSTDILTLVKMILSYDYISYLPSEISRDLQKYFTLFIALSKKEEEYRYQVDYLSVSPSLFASILNSST